MTTGTNVIQLDAHRRDFPDQRAVPLRNPAGPSQEAAPRSEVDAWHDQVHQRIVQLLVLPVGWDGYDAPAVDKLTAFFGLRFLASLGVEKFPAPQIVPGVDGDIQFEWHAETGSIELHFLKPYDVVAWRELGSLDQPQSIELQADSSPIAHWFDDLYDGGNFAAIAASG